MIYVVTLTHKITDYYYYEFKFKRKSNPHLKYKDILFLYNFENVRHIKVIMSENCVDEKEAFLIKEHEIEAFYNIIFLEIMEYKKYIIEQDPEDGDLFFNTFMYVHFPKNFNLLKYYRDYKLKELLK